jgi:hypothetical protein
MGAARSGEGVMKKLCMFTIITLHVLSAQAGGVQIIPFEATAPLKLPLDIYFGEVAGVAVNSKHHVFVYTRTGNRGSSIYGGQLSQLLEFGSDGEFIKDIGGNLSSMSWAHSVRIDKDDDIWLVDNGSDTVVELATDYRTKLVLGRRNEALILRDGGYAHLPAGEVSPAVPGVFNQPTDVAFDAQGNIFVSDGYVNSNIHKFDNAGNTVKLVGSFGSGPLQFKTPHGIAVDDKGIVYVADRGNGRIQVLDNDLNFIREIKYQTSMSVSYVAPIPDLGGTDHSPQNIGLRTQADGRSPVWSLWPNTICISPPNAVGTQYIYTHDMFPGYIQKFTLDGKLVGEVHAGAGRRMGQLGWGHALACVSENEIWIGEVLNWRVQRFILHPERAR